MKMRGRFIPMGVILLSAAMANAQEQPAATVEAVGAAAAAPAVAPAPEFPKRPAELPPKPPKVTCQGDQITISADNSSLEAILAAVKGCTGAKIEIPDGAAHVRSFEELGPGPVRAVLEELLSGTPYNYVILSSEANPLKVEMVMMSMRGEGDDKPGSPNSMPADLPVTNGRRLWQHMQKFDKPDISTVSEDGTVDVDAAAAAERQGTLPVQAAAAQASVNEATAASPDAPVSAASEAPPAAPAAVPVAAPATSSDPAQAVQDRISQMQNMFNQRKEMMNQAKTPPPGGSPNN